MSEALDRRPEARTLTVEELVHRVRSGAIRVPRSERGLSWESRRVLELFDSVLRGYPIGSISIWERPAEATRVQLGPLVIEAPEAQAGWWVVDGRQRLTSLAVGLSRPLPLPTAPDDPFVVYFDAAAGELRAPERTGEIEAAWVPAPLLADSARLREWMRTWPGRENDAWVERALTAGQRLREYVVPLYVIRTDDEDTVRRIFERSNRAGVRVEWEDVRAALCGGSSARPTTLDALAETLEAVGMGRPDEGTLVSCLSALRGLDPSRSSGEQARVDGELLGDALPALRRALSFLRTSAGIPHLRLLPRSTVLAPLTRWFALHPEPIARSRALLARWVWRVSVSPSSLDERSLLRRSVETVGADEEESLQRLLALLPRQAPAELDLGARFDAGTARSRLALLAMAHAAPRDLRTGAPLDVAALLDEHDGAAFVSVTDAHPGAWARLLHPPLTVSQLREALARQHEGRADVLASHLISEVAAQALLRRDDEAFLSERERDLQRAAFELADRYAGWSRADADRPSIAHLLAKTDDEAAE